MKYALTLTIITLISLAPTAQAEGRENSYIMQKRMEAAKTERQSKNLVRKLRNLPKDAVYMVNTTAPVISPTERNLLSVEEMVALQTAAGSSKVAAEIEAK